MQSLRHICKQVEALWLVSVVTRTAHAQQHGNCCKCDVESCATCVRPKQTSPLMKQSSLCMTHVHVCGEHSRRM